MSIARSMTCVASGRPAPRYGAGRGRVGDDRCDLDLDLRDLVDAAGHHRGERGQERRRSRGTRRVLEDPSRRASTVPSRLPPISNRLLRAAVVHRHHVLAAGLGPLQRAAGARGRASRPARPRRQPLAAEAAADVGRDHAHLLGSIPSIPAEHRRGPDAASGSTATPSAAPASSTSAAVERGSTGHAASRWLTLAPLVTTSQRGEQVLVGLERLVRGRCWCRRPRTAGPRRGPPR